MEFYDGMVCPVCEVGKLKVHKEDLEFEYKGEKFTIPEKNVFRCPECEESFLDSKDDRIIEKLLTDERRKVDGLLTSQEIKAIRQQFKMTQVEFAQVLRVSEKTFARYESGQATQGYAMDNLLRILRQCPETIRVINQSYSFPVQEPKFDTAIKSADISSGNQLFPLGETTEETNAVSLFSTKTFWVDAAQAA